MTDLIAFLFVVIFAVLSGAAGAFFALKWRRPGWLRVSLGVVLTALIFAVFLAIQFALLHVLGDTRSIEVLQRTGLALIAACSIFWVPSLLINYWLFRPQVEESE